MFVGQTTLILLENPLVDDSNVLSLATPSVANEIHEEEKLLSVCSSKECKVADEPNQTSKMSSCGKINDSKAIKSNQKQEATMFGSGKYVECLRPFIGLLLSAFGACVMAVAAVMVKRLKSTSVFVILMIRFIVMILMAIPILYFR